MRIVDIQVMLEMLEHAESTFNEDEPNSAMKEVILRGYEINFLISLVRNLEVDIDEI